MSRNNREAASLRTQGRAGWVVVACFAVMVMIGGSNFIAVRFSNDQLPPSFGAAVRFAIASALLFALAAVKKAPVPKGPALRGTFGYGVLNFGLGYAALYFGLQKVTGGMASVIMSSVPLLTLFLAVGHGLEKFRWRGLAGGVLAVAGISLLASSSVSLASPIGHLAAILGGALCVAEAGVIVKMSPRGNPITTNAIAMLTGTVVLVAASLLQGEQWEFPSGLKTWAILAYVALPGSIGLFGLFLFIIRHWTASATSYALTLTPVVAIPLGGLLRGEKVTWVMLGGAALVLLGTYVGALYESITRAGREKLEAALSEAG
ncbi:MAG: DMT family transporter [Actinomycetota bacterium]